MLDHDLRIVGKVKRQTKMHGSLIHNLTNLTEICLMYIKSKKFGILDL